MFENKIERDYFSDRMLIGEVARLTMVKIFSKLEQLNNLSRDEIIALQKEAIEELKREVKELEQEERIENLKENINSSNELEDVQNENMFTQRK